MAYFCVYVINTVENFLHKVTAMVVIFRFTSAADKDWFSEAVNRIITSKLGAEYTEMARPNPVFVDFMRLLLLLTSFIRVGRSSVNSIGKPLLTNQKLEIFQLYLY